MSLEGPRLAYSRKVDQSELDRALRLARELEELLEQTPSVAAGSAPASGARSTRIAHALAAGLVDELTALARGASKPTNIA